MPTPTTISITPGTGLLLDAVTLVVGSNSVIREIMVIADPTNPTSLAGVTSAGAIQVDGSATVQPVSFSGNVTVIQPTPALLNATVVFGSPQHVIVDSGAGAGTQYADNAASGSTPTGTLSMGWDSVNSKIRAVKLDASQNLNVNIAANSFGTITVQGTVSVTNFANPLPVSQSGTWTVRNQDGSGTALTSTGSALDVNLKTSTITLPVSIAAAVDVSDRAARLVGVVYGSQGQQLKQTTTNFNLQTELATGGTLYDARQIRALTSADVVTAAQAVAANLNATVVGTGTFAVQATLNAETTKVIGVVRVSDGAGNLLTSNSTTPAAHFALDSNITSILGTAPTTVGKLDVKGADGDVFVRQTTGTNLHVVLDAGSALVGGVNLIGLDGSTKATTKTSSTQASTADTSITVQLNPVQPNLTTPLNVSLAAETTKVIGTINQGTSPWVVTDTAAAATLVQIQQELRQQSAFPNLGQVAPFQSSASATTLTITFPSSCTLGSQLLLSAMSSTTTRPVFTQTGGTGTAVRGTDLKNSTTSPSVQIDLWRVTVAGTIIMTATFASGACAAIGYEISGLPLSGSLPNSQPFYDSLQISQGTASAATLNSFFTLLPGELPFLFVGLGSASTVSSSTPGTTRLTNFALDGTNVSQNVAASGNLQTFFAGRISGGPLEDMTNMTPAAVFSGSSLFTCIYVSFKPVSMPIGGTVGSVLTQIAGNSVVSAAAGVQQVGIVGGTGVSLETTAGVLDLNLKNVGNNPVVTGTGVSGAGIPRVTISSDSIPSVAATGATAPTSAEEIGFVDTQGKLAAVSATAPLPIQTDPQMLQVVTLLTRILACLESMKVMDGQAYGVYVDTEDHFDQAN